MDRNNLKKLKFKQFCQKIAKLADFKRISVPSTGWISYFRTCLNMRQSQLGKKLGISQPGVQFLERSEKEGGITLESLRKAADVFDCDLVYTFVPRKSINTYIENNALEAAKKEVLAVDHTMALENQSLSRKEIKAKINDSAKDLKNNLDKKLWD